MGRNAKTVASVCRYENKAKQNRRHKSARQITELSQAKLTLDMPSEVDQGENTCAVDIVSRQAMGPPAPTSGIRKGPTAAAQGSLLNWLDPKQGQQAKIYTFIKGRMTSTMAYGKSLDI